MADEKAAKKSENKATSVSTDANIWIQLIGALLLTALLFCVFLACEGLWLNLRRPNLSWTNEIVPIKQSFSVLLAILIGWAYVLVFVGLYMLVFANTGLGAPLYLLLVCLVTAAFDALLLRWLSRGGAKIFEEL